jgi:tRNA threonylcarbamoyladenosine biosynthesis protein TsaB
VILALETATPRASAALVDRGRVAAEEVLAGGRQASETLLASVSTVLARCGVRSTELSCVAVSAGPGSFTGLRVGMAAAKGYCYGWKVPMVLVPTLAALAFRLPREEGRVVCPVLDARKKEVYAALFRWEADELVRLTPDLALAPEALLDRLPGGRIVFCGDGLPACGGLLRERFGSFAEMVEGPEGLPSAGAVGILGERSFRAGGAEDPRAVVPAYVRRSEAEVRRTPPAGR